MSYLYYRQFGIFISLSQIYFSVLSDWEKNAKHCIAEIHTVGIPEIPSRWKICFT